MVALPYLQEEFISSIYGTPESTRMERHLRPSKKIKIGLCHDMRAIKKYWSYTEEKILPIEKSTTQTITNSLHSGT